MFAELLSKLDHPMKTELYRRQVSPGLVGDWKAGRRLPTEVQVAHLAAVTHTDWQELQREITVMRAKPAERDEIAKAVGWRKRSLSTIHRAVRRAMALATMASTQHSTLR